MHGRRFMRQTGNQKGVEFDEVYARVARIRADTWHPKTSQHLVDPCRNIFYPYTRRPIDYPNGLPIGDALPDYDRLFACSST